MAKRAQVTEQTAGQMYGDVLDRLIDRKPSLPSPSSLASRTSSGSDSRTAKVPRIKATFHLNKADILVIDRLQSECFEKVGVRPERSEIVSQALQRLASAGITALEEGFKQTA